MTYFTLADWLVILVYLLGIIGLGLGLAGRQKTTRDYFLGSRNVPWWGIGFSIVAAETSALTIIGVPAMAYGSNLGFIQIVIGYVLARIFLAVIMVPHYLRGEIYSPYQLFANAFGPSARRMAGGIFLMSETLAAGVRVYVACIPLQLLLGLAVMPAVLLFIGLSLVYTYFGGVKAVIWTDAVQFGLFLVGGIFTVCYIPALLPGGWTELLQVANAAGKLDWLDLRFSWAAPFNLWMGLIGATVMVMSSHGAEQLIVQRVLACGSVRDGRRALILSAAMILPLFLIFLLVGVFLWVYYQRFPLPIPLPEPRPGIKAYDFIYPIFMVTAVPPVLKGFLIVAILSAAMSSVSSALTSLASVGTMDFARHWVGREQDEAFQLRFSRASTLGWALLLVVVALLTQRVESVLNLAFALRGLTSGALLGGLLLAVFWRSGSAGSVILGMGCSLAVMIAVNTFLRQLIYWPWYTLLGTLVTLGVAWGHAKLFPRPPAERMGA
jgi:SSS family transporter